MSFWNWIGLYVAEIIFGFAIWLGPLVMFMLVYTKVKRLFRRFEDVTAGREGEDAGSGRGTG